jgi:GH15 family glucan-1,4-alpha-glucosidase
LSDVDARAPHLEPYPPIADYGLIGDCHSAALVSRSGSIDWCCMPRIDSDSCFGRLLDWEKGGHFSITPAERGYTSFRRYVDDTMALETHFVCSTGEARLLDLFAMRRGGRDTPRRHLIRVVEGIRGRVDFTAEIAVRFDYGDVRPWLRHVATHVFAAIGGDSGLLIGADEHLEASTHDLLCRFSVRAQEKVRFSVLFQDPSHLDVGSPEMPDHSEVDRRVEETLEWWRRWTRQCDFHGPDEGAVKRSALVLKALSHAPTGAITAAATTSLPESLGGARNWDYRFSWIRDSTFSVRALVEVGFTKEAEGFRRFIQRSAAGSAEELQIMYGLGGERRLNELELPNLEGYRRSRPVRVGNGAATQLQLDAYGELVSLSWRWHRRGHSPDDDYWRFLLELIDTAAQLWDQPDRGIWEIRGRPRHFVHSKVVCWSALDRGVALATECMRKAPVARWRRTARQIKEAIEAKGVDKSRNCFVQAFGEKQMDSSLLLLPTTGFVDWDDQRMVATTDEVRRELDHDGLLRRYLPRPDLDGQSGQEGAFLACTFWLAECLARQGRLEAARDVFDRAAATGNDLGLYSEEFEPRARIMLGNFPQALTHLSHLTAAVALQDGARGGQHD